VSNLDRPNKSCACELLLYICDPYLIRACKVAVHNSYLQVKMVRVKQMEVTSLPKCIFSSSENTLVPFHTHIYIYIQMLFISQ
jgi:hypothetical protein